MNIRPMDRRVATSAPTSALAQMGTVWRQANIDFPGPTMLNLRVAF